MKEEVVIYSLEEIKMHVEDLIIEFESNINEYKDEIKHIIKKFDEWKSKKRIRKVRKLSYTIQGHSIDIIETLKICNDYIYMNSHYNRKDNISNINLQEFKEIRKNIKRKEKKQISKLYKIVYLYKNKRNKLAHEMLINIPSFIFSNQKEILDSLNQYLELLNMIPSANDEIERMRKRNVLCQSQFEILKNINGSFFSNRIIKNISVTRLAH